MSRHNPPFVHVGIYVETELATSDYQALSTLGRTGVLGTFSAAIVANHGGRLTIGRHEKPARRAARRGLATGALVGAVLPPAVVVSAASSAINSTVLTHVRRGFPKADLELLGKRLVDGETAIVVADLDGRDIESRLVLPLAERAERRALPAGRRLRTVRVDDALPAG